MVVCIYITFDNNLRINLFLQNTSISRRVVSTILSNISPSNILATMLLLERFDKNYQAVVGTCEH